MQIKENYYKFRNYLSKNDTEKAVEYFQKAYEEAFKLFQEKIERKEKFDLSDENELFAVVVITDNILGFWREGMFEEGIGFCENMVDVVDSPKLKEMFKGYSLGMQSGIEINEFLKHYVDLSKVDEEFPQFLCNFKENIKDLIK
jgi:hypothetical protein